MKKIFKNVIPACLPEAKAKAGICLLFFILLVPLTAFAFPNPTGFVNDFAGVISSSEKTQLESMLRKFDQASGNEVVVATLPSLDNRTVEDVAVDLYKTWGIGKKGKDNGILFLIAPNERKLRFEVGYGLEGVINDALAGRVRDQYVIPQFKEGKFSEGIVAGAVAIVKTISDKEELNFNAGGALDEAPQVHTAGAKKSTPLSIAFKILIFLIAAYLFIRHPWLFLLFMSGGGGGGRSRGGFSGGFGGFGGGMSGGGGASGSW